MAKRKKLNLLDEIHRDKVIKMLMTYGHKNMVHPHHMKVIFDSVVKRWEELMPEKKKKGTDETNPNKQ